jgi:hypothetical protein
MVVCQEHISKCSFAKREAISFLIPLKLQLKAVNQQRRLNVTPVWGCVDKLRDLTEVV